jgi:hypothetical protein
MAEKAPPKPLPFVYQFAAGMFLSLLGVNLLLTLCEGAVAGVSEVRVFADRLEEEIC